MSTPCSVTGTSWNGYVVGACRSESGGVTGRGRDVRMGVDGEEMR